ncbi:LIM domain and RING finger protein [Wallemia ichthyophaga EXF-994]|uniref:RING-type E3 ubiquitin transferase n=2 Tax=Wallemia ichthyophaga TaxID=245174 RepID=A0A4T0EW17_WALIC|nr:LIM domain and RING finger protein [Wallemia ichthyophaga EXF-994]TIA78925.1 hypothetical protein E3P98_03593 [Wallemia ichthyophaga]EOQ99534.1 LIM domain and RING finger protein [Wallemia ichthyophaga EXF-994]TIA95757.1 hypothetical protein E3P95_03572 [Wallemia ichthyophaga]TIA96783.1 hypothetical protein E3P94_03579 [Wallemia ichthyophaga]TIB37406.1 hypothetical protein E3P86_02181 [Wallemia ichthyophaga]
MSTHNTPHKPRNGRRNFNGSLTSSAQPPIASATATATSATASESEHEGPKLDNNKGQSVPLPMPPPGLSKASEAPAVDVDQAVCFICAEPVSIWALGPCSHRTCHTCTLRLRALFKNRECTFCKKEQEDVIFVKSATKPYNEYSGIDSWPFDSKLNIRCETKAIMSTTLSMLRFNCGKCDYVAAGWQDLRVHAKNIHKGTLCDLCIRYKKVFTHEHKLFSHTSLLRHLPPLPSYSAKARKVQPAIDSHPGCDFCLDHFYSEDELFRHMRENHEECFLCKQAGIRMLYFKDYPALEKHFVSDHYPCPDATCVDKKFVVFGSELDLRGHQVEEHGAHLTNKERRDVSRLEVNWNPPTESAQPAQTRSATGSGRRAAFGGRLTNQPNQSGQSGQSSAVSSAPATPNDPTPIDPAVAAQHAMVIDKVMNFTKSSNSVQAFKFSIRAFKNSESTARDLIQSLVSILKNNIDIIASVVSQVGILLDNAEKSRELDVAWKEYRGKNKIAQSTSNGGFAQPGQHQQQRIDSFPSLGPSAAAKAGSRALPVWERDASQPRRPQRIPPGSSASSSHYPGLASSSQPRTSTGWSSGGATSSNRHASNFPSLPSSDAVAKANAERRKLFQPHQQRIVQGQSSSDDASSPNSDSRNTNKKQQKKKQTLLTIGL